MRLFSAASGLALLAALAGRSQGALARGFDAIESPVGSVDIADIVSLDLLASPDGDATVYVWGKLSDDDSDDDNDDACLVTVASSSLTSQISGAQADRLALKHKAIMLNGLTVDRVVIPAVKLGPVTLYDVPAVVPRQPTNNSACLQLSLPATGLAWAVMPSTGKLYLAPTAQGTQLTDKLGGTAIQATSVAAHRVRYGKLKIDLSSTAFLVDATIDDQPVAVALGLGRTTDVSPDVVLSGPSRAVGDRDYSWAHLRIGDTDLGSAWFQREPTWRYLSQGDDHPVMMGSVGDDILSHFDIASDGAGKLAFKLATEQVRLDPRPTLLAQAQADLETCLNPAQPPTGDDPDKPPGERCADQYARLASQALMAGDLETSLAARMAVAQAAPGVCENWSAVAELQLALGQTDNATQGFQQASTQFHAWWDLDGYQRDDARKKWSDLPEDQQKIAQIQPQPSACFVDDGMLALGLLIQGKTDKMKAIARDRTDLDPGLPAVYGAWLLMQDDVEAAHGPWRMVEHLSLGPALLAKAGLGRLFSQQGDWDSARANYQAALSIDDEDATVTGMWVDDMALRLGPDAALDEARAWAAQRPDSLAALFGLARAATLAGTDTAWLIAKADAVFAAHVQVAPLDANGLATWSRYLTATGRVEHGKRVAQRAIAVDPTVANAWLALAEAQQASGNAEDAKRSMLHAAQNSGQHPGYTLLLQGLR
ncbi:MAG: hypothetical protein GXP62_07930 [Oligoflexia bacterium]|nr:hypothetical protein [Oligoflexia bacterium]